MCCSGKNFTLQLVWADNKDTYEMHYVVTYHIWMVAIAGYE
jgi:hypothetical protein